MPLPLFRADLHIHSRFSRATSRKLNAPVLAAWAAIKGLQVIGTGDFTHGAWRAELEDMLVPDEQSGLYRLKDCSQALQELEQWAGSSYAGALFENVKAVRFMLQAEISSIYKRGGKVRKVHNLVYMPDFASATALSTRLAEVGNLESDGRPILGLDSEYLLEMVLNTHDEAFLVPAHIWTPWFSVFGSKSGFDRLEDCYGSLTGHIFALETGLSSDPEMNRCLSMLDTMKLISNSDAHSGENLAREANIFAGERSYSGIYQALKQPWSAQTGLATRFKGTLEFFPDEGKYHLDGHRDCGVCLSPEETAKCAGICPVCGKNLTVGVLYRVHELADRAEPQYQGSEQAGEAFSSIIPLPEIIGEVLGVGSKSLRVGDFYRQVLQRYGSELDILTAVPVDELKSFSAPLAEGIERMRAGKVIRKGGFDGEFGVISVFTEEERKDIHMSNGKKAKSKPLSLLPEAPEATVKKRKAKKKQDNPAGIAEIAPATSLHTDTSIHANNTGGQAEQTAAVTAAGDTSNAENTANIDQQIPSSPASTNVEGSATRQQTSGGSFLAKSLGSEQGDLFSVKPASPKKATLNPMQVLATQAGPGPVLVLAGPGTGKTHTLVERIRFLLEEGTSHRRILALTFTRRAAMELDERLQKMLTSLNAAAAEDAAAVHYTLPRSDTLHALAVEFWIKVQGASPVLLSEEAALRVFAETNNMEPAPRRKQAWEKINLLRERMETLPEDLQPFYERYTMHKTAWNLADYTDLLEFWLTQAKGGQFARGWTQVLVDEVQDLSPLQLALIEQIVPQDGIGFFGIGDPQQSIYGFRGAHGRVQEFLQNIWSELVTIRLGANYRSGASVLNFAQSLLFKEAGTGLTACCAMPSEVHLFCANSAEAEATWVAEHIRTLIGSSSHSMLDRKQNSGMVFESASYSPGDFAILLRTRTLMQPYRRALERAGIPFRQPVLDAFWEDERVGRMLEVAGRMLGISTTLPDSVQVAGRSRKIYELECPDAVLVRGPLSMSAYWGNSEPFDLLFWQSAAFKGLVKAFEEQKGWSGLLNWISLQNELELVRQRSEQVQLITIHAAKGLEFPMVFMPALEDGLLPFAGNAFLSGQLEKEQPDVEEEKRLFYVGMTRAKEGLFLSHALKRHIYGKELRLKPSRFLSSLPVDEAKCSAMVEKHNVTQKQLKLF